MSPLGASQELLPHMLYPGAWDLPGQDITPRDAIEAHEWVRADEARLKSFYDSMYLHPLGMVSVVWGVQQDAQTGERQRLLLGNYYLDGLVGVGHIHNHLRAGKSGYVGATEESTLQQDYFGVLPEEITDTLPGLQTVERHLVLNAIEQPDDPEQPAVYTPRRLGESRLFKLGASKLKGLGSHEYSTILVHDIVFRGGPMGVSFLEKGPVETTFLTSRPGLALQGFTPDQIDNVIDFKEAQARKKGFSGVSPVYIEDMPDTDEELKAQMQPEDAVLTDSERDAFMDAIFDGHELMKQRAA